MSSREHHANRGNPTMPDMPPKSNMIEHAESAECALYWGGKWTAILRDGESLCLVSLLFFRYVRSSASLQSNINRTFPFQPIHKHDSCFPVEMGHQRDISRAGRAEEMRRHVRGIGSVIGLDSTTGTDQNGECK